MGWIECICLYLIFFFCFFASVAVREACLRNSSWAEGTGGQASVFSSFFLYIFFFIDANALLRNESSAFYMYENSKRRVITARCTQTP